MLITTSLSAAEWRLDLEGAWATQHVAHVYINERDGSVVQAFALAPTFNKAWGRVDAAKVRRQGETWSGQFTIELPSDGWRPAPGTALKLEVDLAPGTNGVLRWQGRDNGEPVAGVFSVHPLKSTAALNPALLTLVALQGNPQPQGEQPAKFKPKNLQLRMALCDDRAEAVILREAASPVDTSNDIVVTRHDIGRRAGRWRGSIEAEVRHQVDRRAYPWTWQLEVIIIGDKVAGTLTVTPKTGTAGAPLLVIGSVHPVSEVAGQAVLMPLVLNGALPDAGNLECYLEFNAGRVVAAFATGPSVNNATHVVDARDLLWSRGRLRGTLGVVLQADPWTPPDHLPVPLVVAVDGSVIAAGTALQGRFTGHRGSQPITGSLDALFQPTSPTTQPTRATIKFEDGLLGGGNKAWLRRVFVGVTLNADGRVTGGKISNNHSTLSGMVESGELHCGAGQLEGAVNITAREGNIQPGGYRFRFKGPLVGGMATGLFELLGDKDEVLKTGSFWALIERSLGGVLKE
jgi:hypothetical protein